MGRGVRKRDLEGREESIQGPSVSRLPLWSPIPGDRVEHVSA